jgi:hypothetical protein
MRTTTHILNHQRSGNTLELVLDEESGACTVRFGCVSIPFRFESNRPRHSGVDHWATNLQIVVEQGVR